MVPRKLGICNLSAQTDDCKLYLIFQQCLINVASNVCGLTSVWCIPCAVSDKPESGVYLLELAVWVGGRV